MSGSKATAAETSSVSIISSSILMDDYFVSQDVYIDTSSIPSSLWSRPLSAFINPSTGAAEAVMVGVQDQKGSPHLVHLLHDPSSTTGWSVETVPSDGSYSAVREVVATVYQGRVVVLFAADTQTRSRVLYHCYYDLVSKEWSLPVPLRQYPTGRELSVARCDPQADQLFFAYRDPATGSYWLLLYRKKEGAPSLTPLQLQDSNAKPVTGLADPTPFLMSVGNDGNWSAIVQAIQPGKGKVSAAAYMRGALSTMTSPLSVIPLEGNEAQSIPLDSHEVGGKVACLIAGISGNLYYTPDITSSTPARRIGAQIPDYERMQAARLFTTPDQRQHLMLMQLSSDGANDLWCMSQTADGAWAPPTVMMRDVLAMGLDGVPRSLTSFPVVARNHQVFVMSFDADATLWKPQAVKKPASQVVGSNLSTYRISGRLLDASKQPIPFAEIGLQGSRGVMIWSGGNGYWLPDAAFHTPLAMTTDGGGNFSFAMQAEDLSAVEVTVLYQGSEVGTLVPDQDVRNHLAGTALLPGKVDMTTAFSGTQPIIDSWGNTTGTFCPKLSTASGIAPALAQAVSTIMQSQGQQGVRLGDGTSVLGLSIDLTGRDGTRVLPRIVQCLSRDAIGQQFHSLFGSQGLRAPLALASDAWSGIASFAGSAVKILINFAEGTITFLANLAGAAFDVLTLNFTDLEHRLGILSNMLRQFGNAIADVVNFLKALFNWKDIQQTKEVLETTLTQWLNGTVGSTLPQCVATVQRVSDTLFTTVKQSVDGGLEKLKAQIEAAFGAHGTFGTAQAPFYQPVKLPSQQARSQLFGSSGISASDLTRHPQVNWLAGQLASCGGGVPKGNHLEGEAGASIQSIFDQVFLAVTSNPKVSGDLTAALNALEQLLHSGGRQDALDLAAFELTTLLTLAENVINALVDAAQAVFNAILNALANLTGDAVSSFFNMKLDLGLLTPILRAIFGKDIQLTPKEVILWTIALGATVGWKLVTGSTTGPFSGSAKQTMLDATTGVGWLIAALLSVIISGVIESIVDVQEKSPGALIELLVTGLGIAEFVFCRMVNPPSTSNEEGVSGLDGVALGLSVVGIIAQAGKPNGLLRFWDENVGVFLLCLIGCAQMILVFDDAIRGKTAVGEAIGEGLGVLPRVCQPLVCSKSPWAIAGKSVLNVMGVVAGGFGLVYEPGGRSDTMAPVMAAIS